MTQVILMCVGIVFVFCVSDVLYCMLRCRSTNFRLVSPKWARAELEDLCLLVQRGGMTVEQATAYYERSVGVMRAGILWPLEWEADLQSAWIRMTTLKWKYPAVDSDDDEPWRWPGHGNHDDYNPEDEDNGVWTER